MNAAIVEDHLAVAEMIGNLLRRSFSIGSFVIFASLQEAGRQLPALGPDLVIFDQTLPDGKGIDLFHANRGASPRTRWLLYSGASSALTLREAISAGLDGAVDKRAPLPVLIDAIHAVLAGRRFFCEFTTRDLHFIQHGDALNPTERRIVAHVSAGLEAKAIATAIGSSYKTVLNCLVSIRRKTGASSMVQIADYARRQGLGVVPAAALQYGGRLVPSAEIRRSLRGRRAVP